MQMGFGDLHFNEGESEDFLSETSIADSDFQILKSDDFFAAAQGITVDRTNDSVPNDASPGPSGQALCPDPKHQLSLPVYRPDTAYDVEFYTLFDQNQELLAQIEQEAAERNALLEKVFRI